MGDRRSVIRDRRPAIFSSPVVTTPAPTVSPYSLIGDLLLRWTETDSADVSRCGGSAVVAGVDDRQGLHIVVDTVRRADSVVAGEVSVRASAVRSVSGGDVEIGQSAVRSVQAETAAIDNSAMMAASAGQLSVSNSRVGVLAGRTVDARSVRTLLLIAPRVRGEVRTLIDWKSALAVGAGIVVTRRLLRALHIN